MVYLLLALLLLVIVLVVVSWVRYFKARKQYHRSLGPGDEDGFGNHEPPN